jgi:hypothetical protein
MDYLNIHTSTLDSETFLDAEPVDRATWLMLARYCIGQENSGVIAGARAWTDRKWQQVCRITLKEVLRQCKLWDWSGDDLKVEFYPIAKQSEVQAKRKAAVDSNNKRWGKTPPATTTTETGATSLSDTGATSLSEPQRHPEWNGMEGNRNGREATNHPGLDEVKAYFRKSGSGYADAQVAAVFAGFEATAKDGWWMIGQRVVSDWRQAMSGRLLDRMSFEAAKKNSAPPASGEVPGGQLSTTKLSAAEALRALE